MNKTEVMKVYADYARRDAAKCRAAGNEANARHFDRVAATYDMLAVRFAK